MGEGTRNLARSAAAWLACVTFAGVWLLATSVGATWMTALFRGVASSIVVFFVGRLLFAPLADTLLAVLAEAAHRKKVEDD